VKIPAQLPNSAITALVDTREQTPLALPGLRIERATLSTGDYSVRGLENHVAIERKSLPDCVACCGRERKRFDREIQRLLAYPVRCLVVEANWADIEAGDWRGQMTPKQVGASLISWQVRGLPVCMAGDRMMAGKLVASMLRRAAIHRWREFAKTIELPRKLPKDGCRPYN
jgi:DNA excision repair protein ERCC-4